MKTIQNIGCFFLLSLVFLSCSNETDDKLDGKWQLQKVEINGTAFDVDTIYYNFQTSLFMYQIYQPSSNSFKHCFGFKTVEDNKQLFLELTPYGSISIPAFLPYTDWSASKRNFSIEQLNNTRLVLKGDGKSYVFRKF
ncbi:MAG: lipocalin-like domain-containing protein [Tannerellaceae bacterium]|jgi:hypothetical protein|nr:lipocalin-like domain-containing protein [Tannerellaceae bacterium]